MKDSEKNDIEFLGQPKPSSLAMQFCNIADPGTALDLELGDGGNALFLASKGFEVIALESSQEKIERVLKTADNQSLSIDFRNTDLKKFQFHKNRYSLIMADHIFQHHKKSAVHDLAAKICYGLKKGGVLIGAALTVDDPAYKEMCRKRIPMIEDKCFMSPGGWIYSFFGPREILQIFTDLKILHYSETEFYDSQIGQSQWHGLVEFAFKKV